MRRNKLTMARDLLLEAEIPKNLTGLVYGANLNFLVIRPILDRCMRRGLLVNRGGVYYTTERGKEFIALINQAEDIYGVFLDEARDYIANRPQEVGI